MSRVRLNCFTKIYLLAAALVALPVATAMASPSGFAPDAWTRTNDANTSYFGWDIFEAKLPPVFHGALQVVDDSTPDLGSGITATGTRIFQGNDGVNDVSPTANGHQSGSGNYYSSFDTSNETIVGVAPGGAGGFTTVVLQVKSSGNGSLLSDLMFDMDDTLNTWTLHKHLNNALIPGLGNHWVEWSTQGGNVPFSIKMTSSAQHRTIDSFEVDTFWTSGAAPVVNAISSVPEPAAAVLLGIAAIVGLLRRRHR